MKKILILLLINPIFSYGFEVQGYSSGMSKELVKSMASKNHQLIEMDDGMLEARGSGREAMTFGFCKDRLTTINIFWDANIRNLILVSNEFQSRYGAGNTKTEVKSLNSAYSSGPYYSLHIYWMKEKDTFRIMYGSQDGADNMTVSYHTKTSCSK